MSDYEMDTAAEYDEAARERDEALAQRDEAVALLRLVKKWRDAPDSAWETDLQCWGPEDWGDDIDAFLSRLDSKGEA